MPANLSVNLNAIALLRNRRALPWPSVTELGKIALESGAHGLTVHPRPDERHIRFQDLAPIRALLERDFAGAEFNIEGYPSADFIALVEKHRPDQVTLVPDDPRQATSDHGWDFKASHSLLKKTVLHLKQSGFRVSLFADIETDQDSLKIAHDCGADRIELYTGPYGACHNDPAGAQKLLDAMQKTAEIASNLNISVNAGHDLTVDNLKLLAKALPQLAEVSIGHGLTADALIYGMAETVRRYKRALGHIL